MRRLGLVTALATVLWLTAAVMWPQAVGVHCVGCEVGLTTLAVEDLVGTIDISTQTDFAVASNGIVSYDGETVNVNDLITKECFFTNPVTGHSAVCQLRWPYAFTVTEISGTTDVATSTVDIEFDERPRTAPDLSEEILSENAFATHANWSTTGDFTDTTGAAVYTHSTGAGTLTQASGGFDVAARGGYTYLFNYTISGTTGPPTCSITTAFAATSTGLTIANGAQSIRVVAAASPGNFVISCTSSATHAFTMDDVTLTTTGAEVMGSDLQIDTNEALSITFENATIPTTAVMSLRVTAVANAPEKLRIYVTGRHTP